MSDETSTVSSGFIISRVVLALVMVSLVVSLHFYLGVRLINASQIDQGRSQNVEAAD